MLKSSLMYSQRTLPKAFGAALLGLVLAASPFTAQADEEEVAALAAESAKPLEDNTDAELAEVLRKAIITDKGASNNPAGVTTESLFASALLDVRQTGTSRTNRQSAVPAFVRTAIEADVDKVVSLVQTAFQNARFADYNDKASVVAAITANAVCAAEHAHGNDKVAFKRTLKRVVNEAVIRAKGNDGPVSIATPGNLPARAARGAAGAVTGAISQVAGEGEDEATSLALTVIKTAVRAQPKFYRDIAQAAATALASISELTGGDAQEFRGRTITDAVLLALRSKGIIVPRRVVGRYVKFGIAEAASGNKGAGAMGVKDYAHNNCNDQAVTDVKGF